MSHFLYFLFLQLQNLLIYFPGKDWMVLSGQFENLFISFLLLLMPLKSLSFAVMVLLCLNQLYFKVFHHQLSLFEIGEFQFNDLSYLISSFLLELDLWFWVNLSCCLVVFFIPSKLTLKIKHSFKIPLLLTTLLLILASYVSQYYFFPDPLTSHPLISLLRTGPLPTADRVTSQDAAEFLSSQKTQSSTEKLLLQQEFNKMASSKKNVIVLVLESVGSLQILEHSQVKKEAFPYLHSLQSHMLIFERLYGLYPGTTRSHIALTTGGHTPTKSSLFKLSPYQYTGPSLAREMKKQGYYTLLVSAMGLGFEELDHFYAQAGFDFIFDPDKEQLKQERVNPWGIAEEKALSVAVEKIKQKKEQRFFLQFLSNSTHYPYLFDQKNHHQDHKRQYLAAQKYTDEVIQKLVQALKEQGLLEKTRLYITGDHGEAFGELHPGNFTHRNFLYEENIRNFLLILDFDRHSGPVRIKRVGGLGEIKPTILSTPESLLFHQYQEKIHFFHKNTRPLQWGLVEGDFKYISTQDGKKQELYWLNTDPTEQHNLIDKYPQRARHYQKLLSQWFELKDQQFLKLLKK